MVNIKSETFLIIAVAKNINKLFDIVNE